MSVCERQGLSATAAEGIAKLPAGACVCAKVQACTLALLHSASHAVTSLIPCRGDCTYAQVYVDLIRYLAPAVCSGVLDH